MFGFLKFFTEAGDAINRHKYIAAGIFIFVLIVVAAGVWFLVINRPQAGPEVGNPAPDFSWRTSDGEIVTLRSLEGKMVMLSFLDLANYQTDEGLLQEIVSMQAVRDERTDDELVMLAIVGELSDQTAVEGLIGRYGLTFPVLMDSGGEIAAAYDITCSGVHFFIDSKGTISSVIYGKFGRMDEIDGILEGIKHPAETGSEAPVISNVSVLVLTDKSAVIGWTTERPATSAIVIHPENSNVCLDVAVDGMLVTDHKVKVDGLELGTSYQYRVLSAFSLEKQSRSGKFSFTTPDIDVSPPVIWFIEVSDIGETSAVIEWKTDEPATSQVDYSIAGTSSSITISDDELTTDHEINLSELEPGTSYDIQIKSEDAAGNEAGLYVSMLETISAPLIGHEVGNRAPDFTLNSINGESVTLSDFEGKAVMLHFWLLGCQVCKDEMPLIQTAFDNLSSEDIVVLTVNVLGDAEDVRGFVKSEELTFPVLLDLRGEVDEEYKIPYFPTTYFISAEGVIKTIKEGSFKSPEEIYSVVSSLIAD